MKKVTAIDNLIEEALRLAWDENPQTALVLLYTNVQKEPNDARLHHALGIIHSSCPGNEIKAEQHFRKAIQLDPFFTYPYWYLSKLLVDNERLDDAQEVYQRGMHEKKRVTAS